MTLTANGSPVATVDQHEAVTLTATVKAGSSTLKLGQVRFCDAISPSCQDIHLVGLSQITPAGTATLKFVAPPGVHSYKAEFAGTVSNASSSSAATQLTVTTPVLYPTAVTLAWSAGNSGSYTLTSVVEGVGAGASATPTGELYFLDRNHSNYELGKASLTKSIPALGWDESSRYKLGESTTAAGAFGDFNGDGHKDMAVAVGAAMPIEIRLGDGLGQFTKAQQSGWPTYGFGRYVVSGDFNDDGKVDLVVTPSGSSNLLTLLGNGDGTFTPAPDNITGLTNFALPQTGDFNNDGNADLLLQAKNEAGVLVNVVLFGKGDGTFQRGPEFAYGFSYRLYSVAGDFDGDGRVDLVTVLKNEVNVLFGNGDGTFSSVKASPGNNWTWADVNGDGRSDLIVAKYDLPNGTETPIILLANADRTFTTVASNNLREEVNGYQMIGDFNGDGIVDVYQSSFSDQPTAVGMGTADGKFDRIALAPAVYRNQNHAYFHPTVAADLNEDGITDMLGWDDTYLSYFVVFTQRATIVPISGKAPTGPGSHEVVARYEGDDHFARSVSAPLSLTAPTAAMPIATFSTLTATFASQAVNSASPAQTVLLTNTGDAALAISSLQLSPISGSGLSFASSNDCPASLATGASCKIRFRFVPGSAGLKMSQLTVTDNARNAPQVITLTGAGSDAP